MKVDDDRLSGHAFMGPLLSISHLHTDGMPLCLEHPDCNFNFFFHRLLIINRWG